MDRAGEKLARESFNAFLLRVSPFPPRWRRGRPRPDFYLRIMEGSFAVEVTRAMLTIDVAGTRRTQRGWRAALETLAKTIQHNAQTSGVLSGAYGMHLVPVPNFAHVETQVIESAVDYIRRTQSLDTAPSFVLARRPGGPPLSISKLGPAPNYVGGLSSVGPIKGDNHIEADLREILAERLAAKGKRLRRIRLPRILLVLDSYVYGDLSHWRNVASQLDFSGYHTVARVADRRCDILKTKLDSWTAAV
jgi:hypothetical protein